MYLVPERHWVVANFKEAQTANIRIGQPSTLRVDALGGAKLTGHVASVAPAAGSEFSVVKPDNGSGTFDKVQERIAVRNRLALDQTERKSVEQGKRVTDQV